MLKQWLSTIDVIPLRSLTCPTVQVFSSPSSYEWLYKQLAKPLTRRFPKSSPNTSRSRPGGTYRRRPLAYIDYSKERLERLPNVQAHFFQELDSVNMFFIVDKGRYHHSTPINASGTTKNNQASDLWTRRELGS